LKITNKYGLPQPLVDAISKDNYSKGEATYSATGLMSSPRIAMLRDQHKDKMEEDVSGKLYSFLGTALHNVFENTTSPNYLKEERIFTTVNGVKISGQIDLQETTPFGVILWDYKFTSVWSVQNPKKEWENQLNLYKYLVETVKRETVVGLKVCAMLRDWTANKGGAGYPEAPCVVVDIPVWDAFKAEMYVRDRVHAHETAKQSKEFGGDLPLCSPEDRWMSDTVYAVKREGRKSAIKLFDNKKEADELAEQEKGYVEVRQGEPRRCVNNYCGVAEWCDQYKGERNE